VTAAWTSLVVTVTLAPETTVLPASRGETTELTVLHDRLADPVNLRITTDCRMGRINHDNFKELEGTILTDWVGVENTKVHATGSSTHLSNGTKVVGTRETKDPLVTGLTPDNSTVSGTTASTTTDTNAVHNIALLCLVAKHASLVRTSGVRSTVDNRQVTELPATNTSKEAHHITLLLLPKFTDETISTHFN